MLECESRDGTELDVWQSNASDSVASVRMTRRKGTLPDTHLECYLSEPAIRQLINRLKKHLND